MAALDMFVRGNKILARARFWVPDDPFADADPDTDPAAFTLTDPTTVTFTVLKQARGETQTAYVYGTAAEVTRTATGIYLLTLTPAEGTWHVHAQGTGACHAAAEGSYEIEHSRALA